MRDESNVKRSDEAGEPLQAKTSVDIASRLAKDSILCALAGETTMRRMRHVLSICPERHLQQWHDRDDGRPS